METLTAFVRERTRWEEPDSAAMESMARYDESVRERNAQSKRKEPPTDIAAVLTVIKRREKANRAREKQMGWRLDLRNADLRGADLRGARLEDAHLEGSRLEDAHLTWAHLERAHFRGAHLEGAKLGRAHLERADLRETHLKHAYLWGAHLERAHLGGATGLTPEQLAETFGNAKTQLPEGIARPARWSPEAPEEEADHR